MTRRLPLLLRGVAILSLACLVLQGCTAALWEEVLEEDCEGGRRAGLVAAAVLLTPFTLMGDLMLLWMQSKARGPC